jgi:hypothetical protein
MLHSLEIQQFVSNYQPLSVLFSWHGARNHNVVDVKVGLWRVGSIAPFYEKVGGHPENTSLTYETGLKRKTYLISFSK